MRLIFAKLLSVAIVVLSGASAQAVFIPITNTSFETNVVSSGNTIASISGWSTQNAGTYHFTSTQFPSANGAYDGVNGAYMNPNNNGFIKQILSSNLAVGTYTLTVAVGARADTGSYGGYDVSLGAGSSVLAHDDNSLTVPFGTWKLVTVTYTATASDASLGSALFINMAQHGNGNGGQSEFDAVQLSYNAVPEPASIALFGVAGVTISVYALRRRKLAAKV